MGEDLEQAEARRQAAKDASDELMQMVLGLARPGGLDLAGTPGLFDKMEEIVGRFGLSVPGLDAGLANLRAASGAVDHRTRLQSAAEWAGDLPRMRALHEVPWPDTSHLLPDDLRVAMAEDEEGECDWEDADADALFDPFEDLANGVPGALDALIASGVDLNQYAGEEGRCALQAALEAPGRRVEHLERLIAAGARWPVAGPETDDPVFWAIGYAHRDTITPASERALFGHLFRHGSSPNATSDFFGTATLAAILLGTADEVRLMLDAGGRLEGQMPQHYPGHKLAGYTALMLAAPKPATFSLLLKRGANPDAPCPGGETLHDFLQRETRLAEEMAGHDDWCRSHAKALAASLAQLRGA